MKFYLPDAHPQSENFWLGVNYLTSFKAKQKWGGGFHMQWFLLYGLLVEHFFIQIYFQFFLAIPITVSYKEGSCPMMKNAKKRGMGVSQIVIELTYGLRGACHTLTIDDKGVGGLTSC